MKTSSISLKLNIKRLMYMISGVFRSFTFNKTRYKYFFHPYNFTWSNERMVEIPIVWKEVKNSRHKKILEIGNVLSHYFPINHIVVDKYEKAEGVINKDILKYKPKSKFDLIICISTLEHVGYDEPKKDPRKIIKVIKHVRKLLKSDGKAIFTSPLGYNPHLDNLVHFSKLPFTDIYFFKRYSKDAWVQATKSQVKNSKYDHPFPNSNALVIGVIQKQ